MLKLPVEFKEKYEKLLGDKEATALFTAMNEIMEANQVIQVWTSGGKADQMKSYFRIQYVYY